MMSSKNDPSFRRFSVLAAVSTLASLLASSALANPQGATVTQGTATVSSSGPVETINTSDRAFINWQSFNINAGETTTFIQPSATSLVWNQINDPNPSQILGNLNANGYVVLQNKSGFYIGGQALISAPGLLMTTAPIPMPDLSSGGAWQFDAPPPTASIINYGQINAGPGGSAFLIANSIQNHGDITAPGGNIGLYAGKSVMVSTRPDGRGLSAQVTLPQGSVDNSGRLIADAGTIALSAQVVNQTGLIQVDSVREHDGVIELSAGDSLNIGASSVISAKGGSQGVSSGGSVTLKSGNTYQDTQGSLIDVSGGAQGGNGGQIEISAPQITSINSSITGRATSGYKSGALTIDPDKIVLANSGDPAPGSGTVNAGDPPSAGSSDTLTLDVNSFNNLINQNLLSSINLAANLDIEISTLWTLPGSSTPNSLLSLTAGRNILVDDGAGISAGQNWSLNLSAGPKNLSSAPAAGTDGIYLNGTGHPTYLQTLDGSITLWAANEIQLSPATAGFDAVRTTGGGSISATTQFGDINTGNSPMGYDFINKAPYYNPDTALGGISTAAGGNVFIEAGGSVRSFLPLGSADGDTGGDAGTGAFGPEPGNVTIIADTGNVYGHYVVANGNGSITATKGNIGGLATADNLALSLVKGSWTVNAPNGNIYLQEVRNPDGVFNNTHPPRGSNPAILPTHLFDYDPQAIVSLNAGNEVELLTTIGNLPRLDASGNTVVQVPVLFPPRLDITAGAGGVFLASQLTLFPSAYGELQINTDGNLFGPGGVEPPVELLMSDSGSHNFLSANSGAPGSFTDADHGSAPLQLNDPNPVKLHIKGNMTDLTLVTTEATQLTVDGDIRNSAFYGQNLHTTDKTSITVGGQIFNSPLISQVTLPQDPLSVPVQDLPPNLQNSFDLLLNLSVDPTLVANLVITDNTDPLTLMNDWGSVLNLTTATSLKSLPPFGYNSATHQLGFVGQMSPQLINVLNEPKITVVRFGTDGLPVVDSTTHRFVTDTYTWADSTALSKLIADSAQTAQQLNFGLRVGGPGEFDVTAGSISLGDSVGILSVGVFDGDIGGTLGGYRNLTSVTTVGADVNVTSTGDLDMTTSTIGSLQGGKVTVKSLQGAIDLGGTGLSASGAGVPLGVIATGKGGDVAVSAHGNVNIDGSRVAAYDGGSVSVTSETGNVDAGSGGAVAAPVNTHYVDPATMTAQSYSIQIYGSGILATTLVDPTQISGSPTKPGDITVLTPEGDIHASLGGILQEALNGSVTAGPAVNLTAGTFPDAAHGIVGHVGNIDLGDSGVIGGTVNLSANGNISGLVISRQNSTINAAQNFSGTVLSGGSASVSATGTVSGTIVGITGANVSGGSVGATVLSTVANVNGGGANNSLGASAPPSATANSAAGAESGNSKDQTSGTGNGDDNDPLKKRGLLPTLARLVKRVTVIL